jgi:hypothetical protein
MAKTQQRYVWATRMAPAPKFTEMSEPVAIAANGASGLGVDVPLSELRDASRSTVDGFTVTYKLK